MAGRLLTFLRRHWFLTLYLSALLASHIVEGRRPSASSDASPATLVANGARNPPVRIAYTDVGADHDGPVVVFLHGSPGDHHEVQMLADAVGREMRAISPDLPGFGGSTRDIPDYSFVAHADQVAALLDSLHLAGVNVVGFSRGGAVGLELAERRPDLVASLTLLSSIGVQEQELLGDYHLNHALHWLQLAGLWALRELVPHFGTMGNGMLTVEYARNFYDADQRPLRPILARWQKPMLILHGRNDPLVPLAAAEEHHRLVPQSRLVVYDGNHFLPWMFTDSAAAEITAFARAVETGTAPLRPAGMVVNPEAPASQGHVKGIAAVILLLLLAAATLVSEDLACIGAGLLVARGAIGFGPASIACFAGILGGDLLLYLAGRWLGRPAVERVPLRWFLDRDALARGTELFEARGLSIVLTSRFLPGTRLPTYLAAGVLRVGFWRFASLSAIAVALWTPLLVGLAAIFGEGFRALFGDVQQHLIPTLALLLALYALVHLALAAATWRGRRLLLSRWRRLTRWEFWPMWAFYPPVLLYIGWLALRHGGLRLITCVNPAMPGSGLAGERKSEIFAALERGTDRLAPFRLLPAAPTVEERVQRARDAMNDLSLSFPVVLKPDIGERGSGVAIIPDVAALERYLAGTPDPVILQEYVPGIEAGVFYYRIPGEPRGHVFAITEKRFPSVTGDGQADLERLILSDDRAVSSARFFLARHRNRLEEVPRAGVTVPLVELGTHCRGSAFFDGARFRTGALEDAVDRVSRGYEGFWFGRYDVRAPSWEALQQGEFKVIELNGATSEATSIYDPANSLLTAYRTLFRQWAILFEIARRNRAAGARPATWREIFNLLRQHRAALEAHAGA